MADPKYENLPGIAYDQPDVYETPDNPEVETSDYYEEETENEAIERMHLQPSASFNRFQGYSLDGNVDFSDRIGRRPRKGYDLHSNNLELVGIGEKETPIQKCRRLQLEINELMDEVTALQNDRNIAEEEQKSYYAVASVISTAKKVLQSLRIEQVLGKEEPLADKEVKELIKQVDEYKKSGVLTAIQPQGTDFAMSTRIAKIEYQLHQLEQALGAQPDKISRLMSVTNTSNVLEAVRQLSTKAALLQPEQLDAIDARLNTLITKMDTVCEKASGSQEDAKRDQKICELYDIAKRTEPIADILPVVVERMQTLESLHKYAMNFATIIADIEEKQHSITTAASANKELLQTAQTTFADNLETIKKEINKVQQQVDALTIKK